MWCVISRAFAREDPNETTTKKHAALHCQRRMAPSPLRGEDGVRGSGNPVTNVVVDVVTCACVAADDDGQRNTPFGDRFITPPSCIASE